MITAVLLQQDRQSQIRLTVQTMEILAAARIVITSRSSKTPSWHRGARANESAASATLLDVPTAWCKEACASLTAPKGRHASTKVAIRT